MTASLGLSHARRRGWVSRLWYKHPLLRRVVLHFGEAGARDAWRVPAGSRLQALAAAELALRNGGVEQLIDEKQIHV